MNKTIWRVSLVAVVAALASAALVLPLARAQVHAAPSYVPVGVSASESTSTAWFHQPSSGTLVACQLPAARAGAAPGIQCVSAKLP